MRIRDKYNSSGLKHIQVVLELFIDVIIIPFSRENKSLDSINKKKK